MKHNIFASILRSALNCGNHGRCQLHIILLQSVSFYSFYITVQLFLPKWPSEHAATIKYIILRTTATILRYQHKQLCYSFEVQLKTTDYYLKPITVEMNILSRFATLNIEISHRLLTSYVIFSKTDLVWIISAINN